MQSVKRYLVKWLDGTIEIRNVSGSTSLGTNGLKSWILLEDIVFPVQSKVPSWFKPTPGFRFLTSSGAHAMCTFGGKYVCESHVNLATLPVCTHNWWTGITQA
jgi:hypothetical protein